MNQLHHKHPTIGLGLSGGATRGMAHIGVLSAFKKRGLKPDYLAGTSIGALVAALFAFGIPIEEIRKQAEEMSWIKISSLSISKSGLLSNRIIGEIVEKHLGKVNLEDAPIPLSVVTTDILSGQMVILTRGSLSQAIMASTCIPGVFKPIDIDGRLLVDGFLVANVPVTPLMEKGADIIVAVSLSSQRLYRPPDDIVSIIMNAFEIAIDTHTNIKIRHVDVLIKPDIPKPDTKDYMGKLYQAGHAAGLRAVPKIQQALRKKGKELKPSFWRKITRRFQAKVA